MSLFNTQLQEHEQRMGDILAQKLAYQQQMTARQTAFRATCEATIAPILQAVRLDMEAAEYDCTLFTMYDQTDRPWFALVFEPDKGQERDEHTPQLQIWFDAETDQVRLIPVISAHTPQEIPAEKFARTVQRDAVTIEVVEQAVRTFIILSFKTIER